MHLSFVIASICVSSALGSADSDALDYAAQRAQLIKRHQEAGISQVPSSKSFASASAFSTSISSTGVSVQTPGVSVDVKSDSGHKPSVTVNVDGTSNVPVTNSKGGGKKESPKAMPELESSGTKTKLEMMAPMVLVALGASLVM